MDTINISGTPAEYVFIVGIHCKSLAEQGHHESVRYGTITPSDIPLDV